IADLVGLRSSRTSSTTRVFPTNTPLHSKDTVVIENGCRRTGLRFVIHLTPPVREISLERLFVEFVCDEGVHHRRHVIDLLLVSTFEELSITVCVLDGDRITHRE